MSTWVDFKTIKQHVKIREVLEHYDLLGTLKPRGTDNLVGPCPIHNGTNPTQFHVSLAKNNFNCFGDCHGGGNVIDFVAKMEGVDVRQAALKMQAWFGIEQGGENEKQQLRHKETAAAEKKGKGEEKLAKEREEAVGNAPLSFTLKHLDPDHPYLTTRGFTKETVIEFGVGYCQKGLMAGRVAIPIHNEKGDLVAYAGRWPGEPPEEEGKYKLPPHFHKSLTLFNLHRAKDYVQDQGLILVEGFFDVMRLWQGGVKHVVALMGSSLSPEQEVLIVDAVGKNGKVALLFDEDEAGWKCRADALTRLSTQAYVKVIALGKEGAQPDSLQDEELRELGLLEH